MRLMNPRDRGERLVKRLLLGDTKERESEGEVVDGNDAAAHARAQAIALATGEGVNPFSLIPNHLDEEPCDGVLPLAGEAHFAWRDRLRTVDRRR